VKVKVEVGITFLTQHLGSSIFDPNLGWKNPAFFRVEGFGLEVGYYNVYERSSLFTI